MIRFLTRVNWKHPQLTRDPKVWFQYFCWCIQFWMWTHKPYYPVWIRKQIYLHWPHAHKRWSVTWKMVKRWQEINPQWQLTPETTPLPWYIGVAGLGIFVKPWERVERWFGNRTGGRFHGCEFTDPKRGALYGGQDGAFMDDLFEQFIENISEQPGLNDD